jgi:hypothetical protein
MSITTITTATQTPTQPDPVEQEVLASRVLQQLAPELAKLEPDDLVTNVALDIPTAVSTVLGSLPEIRAQRDELAAKLPDFDPSALDKLEDYALALSAAHAALLAASQPSSELRAVVEEATEVRELLLSDATALVRRGLLSSESIADLKGPMGFRNISTDVFHLVEAIRARWADIESKSAITQQELDRAERLQQRLNRLLGLKDQQTPDINAASEQRRRALTLLLRAYDEVRRAITYLRWKTNDIDDIAPSLFAGRGGRRKSTETTPATPTAPAVTPGTGTTTTGTQQPTTNSSAATPGAHNAVATPGSDPFLG